jgi:hypothetical protein
MNEPSELSTNEVAWAGPLTRPAVRIGPSESVSFARTPGAATLSVPPSLTSYSSSLATGASLTGVMVMCTVATDDVAVPSVAV